MKKYSKILIAFLMISVLSFTVFADNSTNISNYFTYIRKQLDKTGQGYLDEIQNYVGQLVSALQDSNEVIQQQADQITDLKKQIDDLNNKIAEKDKSIQELVAQLEANNEVLEKTKAMLQTTEKYYKISFGISTNFDDIYFNTFFMGYFYYFGLGVSYSWEDKQFKYMPFIGINFTF